jgi:hypothetical protein
MSKSGIRLAKVYQIIMIAAAILFFALIPPQQASAAPGTIKVVGMAFGGSYECVLSDYGILIYDPIWRADNYGHITSDQPAAFQRQGAITIYIDVSSPDITIPSGGLLVRVSMSGSWSSSGGLAFNSQSKQATVNSWPDGDWASLYFTSLSIPSSRPIGRDLLCLFWTFEYYKNGTWYSGGGQQTVHRIFFPYANPSSTWGAMTNDFLWKQAIDHAGFLFDLIDAETNDLYYAKYYMTSSFYSASGTEYEGWHSHHTYYNDFNMKSFLTDFYSDPWADCRDTSSDLQACCRALGISCYSRTIDPYDYDYLNTKSIDPVGSGYGWITTTWNFHQIAWSYVWDPCIRVNQPSPILPTNMGVSSYRSYLYQSGYWNVGNSFVISVVR